ncbi:MAG: hypothetical protein ACI9BN_001201, partial [Francisella sp.]
MPYKYPKSKDWHVPKQKYKITNWSEYNKALKNRGSIDFWLTDNAIEQWYEVDQDNIGCRSPQKYTDFAIIICCLVWGGCPNNFISFSPKHIRRFIKNIRFNSIPF